MIASRSSEGLPTIRPKHTRPACMHSPHVGSQLLLPARKAAAQAFKTASQSRRLKCSAASQPSTVLASNQLPSLQLATAKLPKEVDPDAFSKNLYDWASTMTSSGRNMPFSLPLRTRPKDRGFEISLLRVSKKKQLVPVGHIVAHIEEEPQVGNVLFVRFFEGDGAEGLRSGPLPTEPRERLKTVIEGLVDVPLIMSTMRDAIKRAVAVAK